MIWTILASLKVAVFGSTLGRISAAAVVALTAFWANNAYQRHVGAERLATKIEKKVDANVKATDAARARSRSGDGGVLDPYLRKQ